MPDLATAIPGLLQKFEHTLRAEAERLVEDGAVVNLDAFEGQVDADVMLDDKAAHVRWTLGGDGWEAETDTEPDLDELAQCAVLLAVQKGAAHLFPSPHVPAETFQVSIEKNLGRPLTPDEEQYVVKIEKRFQRVGQVRQIFDHDMVRLHPKWSIDSYDALSLWPTPPRTTREFWNYVAVALDEKGLAIPAFLKGVTQLDETREQLREWKKARTIPQWMERIRRFAADAHANPEPDILRRKLDFRLILTPNEARLQSREEADVPFQFVGAGELNALRRDHSRGSFSLDAHAELLLLACFCQMDDGGADSFRLDVERNAAWVNSLFQQPNLHSRLVTLDEVPFRLVKAPLRWEGHESADGGAFRLRLVTADGGSAPSPLRLLPGTETLYLSAEEIFRGPSWFGDDTRVEQVIEIPLQALSSADGVAFLEKLGVCLPDTLAGRVRRDNLRVEIRANSAIKSTQAGAEYVTLSVRAIDNGGVAREELRDRGWMRTSAVARSKSDEIVCYDRAPLSRAAGALEDLRAVFDPELAGFRVRVTKNFPDLFQHWAQHLPEGVSLQTDERLQTILADPLIARVRLEAAETQSIDWFDLKLVFEIEGADLKPADIRRLIAAKGGFVRLADGTWRRVQLELSDEQREIIERLGIDLDEFSDEAHRMHMRHLAGQKAAEFINPKAWQQIATRLADADISGRSETPSDLQITLRPYQVEGFHFLSYLTANHIGGILADDMGLGKTLQSIAWILWLRDMEKKFAPAGQNGGVPPMLVVCPKSVLDVWAVEFTRAAPHLRIQVLHDRDELKLELLQESIDVLVLNYAQLRGCIEQLAPVNWLGVILDEGQQIKNPDSKAARAARRLRARNRLVLTGTPLENRLLDLWSLMTFATPGALGDRGYFHRHFDRRKDDKATERLSSRLRPFILRRTKGQVAKELPPRTEESMLCEMTGLQERLYRDELARAQHMVLTSSGFDALNRHRFAILQALTRLRQICCHPGLVRREAIDEESAKLTATLELVEQLHEEGHKVLLFSQFVTMLKIIRDKLETMGLPYHWLTGASTDRASIVRGFQEDKEASVFLLSLKAGGSGLNLTAASYVILYDPWWNPAVEAQAIDRAHRIGQTQPVMAYRMLTKNTIEEKILLLQQQKQMMSSNILGEQNFSRALDRQDFEFLFGLEEPESGRQR